MKKIACLNCIHSKVCNGVFSVLKDFAETHGCEDFQDKSLFVLKEEVPESEQTLSDGCEYCRKRKEKDCSWCAISYAHVQCQDKKNFKMKDYKYCPYCGKKIGR